MSEAELKQHGVTPGMIRISVGVEGVEDLITDFEQALKKI
jgi:O-acetylhomoserine (thiol)-lyase